MNKNIYLLYGPERHLIKQKIDEITEEFFDKSNKNVVKFDMLEASIDDALEDLRTISIFEEKKAIICENCYFLTAISSQSNVEQDVKMLLKVINAELDNILILTVNEDKLDDRKKVVKELKSKTNVICFSKLKKDELKKYINNSFSKDNYKIDDYCVNLLLEIVGEDLDFIVNEIEKLKICKFEEREIFEEDIENLCSKKINDNIFDLVDAVITRDTERALGLYEDLLIVNEEPIKMIAVIANQFRLAYQTKSMSRDGYSEFEISKHLEVHPYRVKLANETRTDESVLLYYLEKLADLDLKIKTGEVDRNIAFEMFLIEI